jgi:hypothetical protein
MHLQIEVLRRPVESAFCASSDLVKEGPGDDKPPAFGVRHRREPFEASLSEEYRRIE